MVEVTGIARHLGPAGGGREQTSLAGNQKVGKESGAGFRATGAYKRIMGVSFMDG